ncbi:MAG: amidase [Polaromonas sp.]|nr:amidase [Polaromonas sp.]
MSVDSSEDRGGDTSMRTGFFAGRSMARLAHDLRERRLSSPELVEAALASIDTLNPHLNAFVVVDADGARAAALRADAELRQGTDRGPLHGMPVAIKDIIDVEGMPTTQGSSLYAGHVASRDAACVRQLREAGAIVIGKTTLHEFAYGATGDRSAHGAARNPWSPTRMSGGSSGGSAVAVASGMVPLALGTDTAGSVRVPAALCGVVGLKPAYDAISSEGVFPLAKSLDHVGLFTRTAEDCELAYACLARHDASGAQASGALGSAESPGVGRIGWLLPSVLAETDHRIEQATRACVARTGSPVQDVDLAAHVPQVRDLFEVFSVLQGSEAFAAHVEDVARAGQAIDAEVLARLRRGEGLAAWQYIRALEQRAAYGPHVAALLTRHDVLALPTVPMTAPAVGERSPHINGVAVEVRAALLSLTSPWNLVSLPAISVPAGTLEGLPIAVQLVSAPGKEALLFKLAQAVERSASEGVF